MFTGWIPVRLSRRAHACDDLDVQPLTTDAVDFAIAAWREDGRWYTTVLPMTAVASFDAFVAALHALPADDGAFGFLSLDDEILMSVRVIGNEPAILISDGMSVFDWAIAKEAADSCDLDVVEEELEDFEPVGDIGLFSDFGFSETDVEMLCEDEDLYPDDQLRAIAKRLGFADQLTTILPVR